MAADLQRFLDAQHGVYDRALAEIRGGSKTTHWMWFVFPQLAGLGTSPTAQRYAIASLAQARQYADHQVLGARLRESAAAARDAPGSAERVFGGIDALKLRSSMTLFAQAVPVEPVFAAVLDRHYAGLPDERTLSLLA